MSATIIEFRPEIDPDYVIDRDDFPGDLEQAHVLGALMALRTRMVKARPHQARRPQDIEVIIRPLALCLGGHNPGDLFRKGNGREADRAAHGIERVAGEGVRQKCYRAAR